MRGLGYIRFCKKILYILITFYGISRNLPTKTNKKYYSKKRANYFLCFFRETQLIHIGKNICINKNLHPYKQVFTICHEVGHYINGDTKNIPGVSYWESIQEKKADQFAIKVLLPKKKLIEKYKLYKGDFNILEKIFGVDKEIIEKRVKKLIGN